MSSGESAPCWSPGDENPLRHDERKPRSIFCKYHIQLATNFATKMRNTDKIQRIFALLVQPRWNVAPSVSAVQKTRAVPPAGGGNLRSASRWWLRL